MDEQLTILLASLYYQSQHLVKKSLHLPAQWANTKRPRPGLRCELAGLSMEGLSYQGGKIGRMHPSTKCKCTHQALFHLRQGSFANRPISRVVMLHQVQE